MISWELDGLDRILDELGIYEGVCISCYGKDNYDTIEGIIDHYYPIVSDQRVNLLLSSDYVTLSEKRKCHPG